MSHLLGQHVLILGLGHTGLAMARWCARCGARVTVADTRAQPPQLEALQRELPDARFVHGALDASLLAGSDVRALFKSPGLAPAEVAAVVAAAREQGLWVGGELSLFAQALAELKASEGYCPQLLAVSGTNGKTTVTALTAQLVERAGKSVVAAGNIGPTLLDTLREKLDAASPHPGPLPGGEGENRSQDEGLRVPHPGPLAEAEDEAVDGAQAASLGVALPEVWVLELSSFQLADAADFEATAATLLNISQDHLDWHGSLDAYIAAKARVFGKQGLMLLNRDDPLVMALLAAPVPLPALGRGRQPRLQQRAWASFGADMPQRAGDFGIEVVNGMAWLVRAMPGDETIKVKRGGKQPELHIQRLMPADALRIRGRHNALNALAALALASAAGCGLAATLHGLREYRGEPHRVQSVGVLDGVEYFDDSKGTNVGATVAALAGLGADRRLVLILGGEGKGQDFGPLAAPVTRYARAVVLIGRDANLIQAALQGTGVPMLSAQSMAQAVPMAQQCAQTGDAVLLSPACASFDMFDHYEHRAQVFVQELQNLAQESGAMLEGVQ
ncbi:MAG: UDP-N-acetylmuramoyl-L-alanine--D-glutamate ligase [Betaproteobacteria bacterium]